MRCYSHMSDDERERIGLAKALGHSIGAIAQAIGRPKSTISRELSGNKLPSGRYSPLHAAGAYQLRRRREALIERDRVLRPSLSTASPRVNPGANLRLAILAPLGSAVDSLGPFVDGNAILMVSCEGLDRRLEQLLMPPASRTLPLLPQGAFPCRRDLNNTLKQKSSQRSGHTVLQ